eukprot:1874472-Alexandrium_andersonii.AAC.1
MSERGRGGGNTSAVSQRVRLPLRAHNGGRAALAAPRAGVSPVDWARCVGSPSMHSPGEAPQEPWRDPTVWRVVRSEP